MLFRSCDFEKWDREKTQVSWHYGATGDGSKGEGLYQGIQGARIRYTSTTAPEMGPETKRNMEVLLEADPAEVAVRASGCVAAIQFLSQCRNVIQPEPQLPGCQRNDPEPFGREKHRSAAAASTLPSICRRPVSGTSRGRGTGGVCRCG